DPSSAASSPGLAGRLFTPVGAADDQREFAAPTGVASQEAKKRVTSKASCLRSRWKTARPSRAASAPRARALPRFFCRRSSQRLACSLWRSNRQVASEKAHLRWALPILFPPEPFFLPADSWAQRTSRA